MRFNNLFCIGLLVTCMILAGCGKGKPASKKGSTKASTTAGKSADTNDIFKEFYSDDTSALKKAPAAAKQTFSPSTPTASSADFDENGRYVVQVSSVQSESFAQRMANQLKNKGYPAYVVSVDNPTPNLSGTYYRVRIGGFNGLSAAKSFCENNLSAEGYEFWVDNKSNDNVGMRGDGFGAGSSSSSYGSTPSSSTSTWGGSSESNYETTTPAATEPTPAPATDASSSAPADQPAASSSNTGTSAPASGSSSGAWGGDTAATTTTGGW
jgi:hypothetical protein